MTEQRQIAAYLDRETGQIDELIAKQEQLLTTLAERRQATISSAVSPAPGADAGWTNTTMRRVIKTVDQGVSPDAEAAMADGDAWGVVKAGCVNGGVFDELQHKRLERGFEVNRSMAISTGDFIVNRASGSLSLLGSAAIVRGLTRQLILSDKTYRFTFETSVHPDFVEWFMKSTSYRQQVLAAVSGAGGLANNLSLAAIRGFRLQVPSLGVQRQVSVELRSEIHGIEALSAKATQVISLLRERRQALISAAVTGKIDVRGK